MEIIPGIVAYILYRGVSWIYLILPTDCTLLIYSAWIDPATDVSVFEDVSWILVPHYAFANISSGCLEVTILYLHFDDVTCIWWIKPHPGGGGVIYNPSTSKGRKKRARERLILTNCNFVNMLLSHIVGKDSFCFTSVVNIKVVFYSECIVFAVGNSSIPLYFQFF